MDVPTCGNNPELESLVPTCANNPDDATGGHRTAFTSAAINVLLTDEIPNEGSLATTARIIQVHPAITY